MIKRLSEQVLVRLVEGSDHDLGKHCWIVFNRPAHTPSCINKRKYQVKLRREGLSSTIRQRLYREVSEPSLLHGLAAELEDYVEERVTNAFGTRLERSHDLV